MAKHFFRNALAPEMAVCRLPTDRGGYSPGAAMKEPYQASPIKRRRASKTEMAERANVLHGIVSEMQPMTVRQVFYQASVRGIVEKTESGYDKVQRMIMKLRERKILPWSWITDSTRLQRKRASFSNIQDALQATALVYRKALWDDANCYVEIWLEKDALSGVVYPVTEQFDVPLMIARGYSSGTFLHNAAEEMAALGVTCYIYQLGDHDPSGVDAAHVIEAKLRKYAPNADIHFERLAITKEQISKWNLPSRETKKTDPRAKNFVGRSVELDSVPPQVLRDLVESAIRRHISQHRINILKIAEASERNMLQLFVQSGISEGYTR